MSEETEGETPQSPPEGGSPTPLPPVMKPDQTTEDPAPSKTVGGAHDLSDHPAVASGNVKNVGDTVLNRDPNAPSFRRPPLEVPAEQSEGERTTTTSNPAKKASKGKSKGDGAGPES